MEEPCSRAKRPANPEKNTSAILGVLQSPKLAPDVCQASVQSKYVLVRMCPY